MRVDSITDARTTTLLGGLIEKMFWKLGHLGENLHVGIFADISGSEAVGEDSPQNLVELTVFPRYVCTTYYNEWVVSWITVLSSFVRQFAACIADPASRSGAGPPVRFLGVNGHVVVHDDASVSGLAWLVSTGHGS